MRLKFSLWATHKKERSYLNNLLDFILADGSIPIHIVQGEGPLQFLQRFTPRGEVKRYDILFKVQGTVCVRVKTPEHVPGISTGVGVGEKACVDAFKLLLADLAAGAFLKEALVPGAQLRLWILSVRLQVLQNFLGKRSTLWVAHGGCSDTGKGQPVIVVDLFGLYFYLWALWSVLRPYGAVVLFVDY